VVGGIRPAGRPRSGGQGGFLDRGPAAVERREQALGVDGLRPEELALLTAARRLAGLL